MCRRSVLADAGYRGVPFAQAIRETLGVKVQIIKRDALFKFAVMPKRWVMKISFAWLKCRRLWKNCELKLNTSLQLIHFAFHALLLKRS